MKKIFLFFILLFIISCKKDDFGFLKDVFRVDITDSENTYTMSQKEDIRNFIANFKTIKLRTTIPSCPLELLKIIFYSKSQTYTIYYAADLCPVLKFNNRYYEINEDANILIRRIMKEHGIKDQIW